MFLFHNQKQSFSFRKLDKIIAVCSTGSATGNECSPHNPNEAEKRAITGARDQTSILALSSTNLVEPERKFFIHCQSNENFCQKLQSRLSETFCIVFDNLLSIKLLSIQCSCNHQLLLSFNRQQNLILTLFKLGRDITSNSSHLHKTIPHCLALIINNVAQLWILEWRLVGNCRRKILTCFWLKNSPQRKMNRKQIEKGRREILNFVKVKLKCLSKSKAV